MGYEEAWSGHSPQLQPEVSMAGVRARPLLPKSEALPAHLLACSEPEGLLCLFLFPLPLFHRGYLLLKVLHF